MGSLDVENILNASANSYTTEPGILDMPAEFLDDVRTEDSEGGELDNYVLSNLRPV